MTYTITKNADFGSIEIHFNGKPAQAVRDALKALKFRWHGVRRVWYGYTDAQAVQEAIKAAGSTSGTEQAKAPANVSRTPKKSALAPLWERVKVDELPGYGGSGPNAKQSELAKAARENARKTGKGFDRCAAEMIRAHLRERFPEVKFSVTSGGAGYLERVDIRIISSPYNREKVMKNRYTGEPDPWGYWQNSPQLDAVLNYCKVLHDSFDSDDGDYYADYGAYHDLYGFAEISEGYTQTAPTPEQQAYIAAFEAARQQAEQKAAEEERQRMDQARRERERAEEAAKRRAEEERQAAAAILDHVNIIDLSEAEQIAALDLMAGAGKENSMGEVYTTIDEKTKKANKEGRRVPELLSDAIISRKVLFTDRQLYHKFSDMLLNDWDFLAGKGGTDFSDVRLKDFGEYMKLNAEQRATVHTFAVDCVGVYLDNVLQCVIDPQGFNYARYVLVPFGDVRDSEEDATSAAEYRAKCRAESETLPGFYIPEAISEQIKAVDLRPGEPITAILIDGLICSSVPFSGRLVSVTPCEYAQYEDAARVCLIPYGKRTEKTFFIHTGQKAVIYRGILPNIPDEIKYTPTSSPNMRAVNYAGTGAHSFIKRAIAYYETLGYTPAIDTVER